MQWYVALGLAGLAAVLVGTLIGFGLAADVRRKTPDVSGVSSALIVLSGAFIWAWGPVWLAWRLFGAVRGVVRRALLHAVIRAMQDDPSLRVKLRSSLSDGA